jgi:nitrite reductase/ring-hydroxylating ferredoxin subunit
MCFLYIYNVGNKQSHSGSVFVAKISDQFYACLCLCMHWDSRTITSAHTIKAAIP